MENDFSYGQTLCQLIHGIEMKEEDYEEIGLLAWGLIGNKKTRIYRYQVCMNDCDEPVIELPCNCDIIEAVTTGWEDWGNVTNDTVNGNLDSAYIEQYIESRKSFHDPLYQSGKFIKYERVGDTLYLDRPYRVVNILYRGIILDDNGLPKLNDKEARAIATYCAYIKLYKEALLTKNPQIMQFANQLKQDWAIQCDQARTPDYINQNEIDQILDAKTNWNRKVHSKSYKYVR